MQMSNDDGPPQKGVGAEGDFHLSVRRLSKVLRIGEILVYAYGAVFAQKLSPAPVCFLRESVIAQVQGSSRID